MEIETINTILYCNQWRETTAFYRDVLRLKVLTATDWMTEFSVAPHACLSVADATRTSIRPAHGTGITLTFKVDDLHGTRRWLADRNIAVDPIRDCRMGGQAFFLRDPEGNRLEFWDDSPWNSPEMVARLSSTPPNEILMDLAARALQPGNGCRAVDIGCGAGCNAVPLAQMGWNVLGIDLSGPMLAAAQERAEAAGLTEQLQLRHAAMDRLPLEDQSCDLIVAHGCWNLARSAAEFRASVREAARVAKPGALLFVYTFSRSTLPPETRPIAGEPFVFTEHSGRPQCFLTEAALIAELGNTGFAPEPDALITEYPAQPGSPKPAILEGIFRKKGKA